MNNLKKTITFGALILLLLLSFVNPESFWIDEGNTAIKAIQPDIQHWYQTLVSLGGSDSQMPGFMLYVWVWEKVFGNSEYAMRSSNVIWIMIACYAMWKKKYFNVFLLTSPFTIYYLSELRPYAMQIAGGSLTLAGVVKFFCKENRIKSQQPKKLFLGLLILCASSLTGVIWSIGTVIGCILYDWKKWLQMSKSFWGVTSALAVVPLCIHYCYTLLLGHSAADMGGNILVSMGAVFYEILGFSGIGPSRITLRENPKSVIDYLIPMIILSLAIIANIINYTKDKRIYNRKEIKYAAACIVFPVIVYFVLIIVKDFRVLARHFTPAFPVVVYLISHSAANIGKDKYRRKINIIANTLILVLWIVSSLNLRFNKIHKKDDYREAVMYAVDKIKKGKTVYWHADVCTKDYYIIKNLLESELSEKFRNLLLERNKNTISVPMSQDEIVILSKPDIYDKDYKIRNIMKSSGFHIIDRSQGFTMWTMQENQ